MNLLEPFYLLYDDHLIVFLLLVAILWIPGLQFLRYALDPRGTRASPGILRLLRILDLGATVILGLAGVVSLFALLLFTVFSAADLGTPYVVYGILAAVLMVALEFKSNSAHYMVDARASATLVLVPAFIVPRVGIACGFGVSTVFLSALCVGLFMAAWRYYCMPRYREAFLSLNRFFDWDPELAGEQDGGSQPDGNSSRREQAEFDPNGGGASSRPEDAEYAWLFQGLEISEEMLQSIFVVLGKSLAICSSDDQFRQLCVDEIFYQLALPRRQAAAAAGHIVRGAGLTLPEISRLVGRGEIPRRGLRFARGFLALVTTPLFYDEHVTAGEQRYFRSLAECLGISRQIADGLFAAMAARYDLLLDETEGDYVSSEILRSRRYRRHQEEPRRDGSWQEQRNGAGGSRSDRGRSGRKSESLDSTTDEIRQAYVTLQCSRNDPDDTLRRTYRRLLARYHPDKAMSLGLSPESVAKCTEMTKAINVAWEIVCRDRGSS